MSDKSLIDCPHCDSCVVIDASGNNDAKKRYSGKCPKCEGEISYSIVWKSMIEYYKLVIDVMKED